MDGERKGIIDPDEMSFWTGERSWRRRRRTEKNVEESSVAVSEAKTKGSQFLRFLLRFQFTLRNG